MCLIRGRHLINQKNRSAGKVSRPAELSNQVKVLFFFGIFGKSTGHLSTNNFPSQVNYTHFSLFFFSYWLPHGFEGFNGLH